MGYQWQVLARTPSLVPVDMNEALKMISNSGLRSAAPTRR